MEKLNYQNNIKKVQKKGQPFPAESNLAGKLWCYKSFFYTSAGTKTSVAFKAAVLLHETDHMTKLRLKPEMHAYGLEYRNLAKLGYLQMHDKTLLKLINIKDINERKTKLGHFLSSSGIIDEYMHLTQMQHVLGIKDGSVPPGFNEEFFRIVQKATNGDYFPINNE